MAVESSDIRAQRISHRDHDVSIIVNGRQVDGWLEYQIDDSLVEPASSFTLRRPFDRDAWFLCRRDARVYVLLDGIKIISGFIDTRIRRAADGTLEIAGRCQVGRLLQDAAPRTQYGGLDMKQLIEKLASPWFRTVTFSNARNRRVRRGKGKQVAAYNEAIQIPARPKNQRIDPGKFRWDIISEVVSAAGCICWSSSDGTELFVGRPNHNQPPQYLCRASGPLSSERSTVIDIEYAENNADRFAKVVSLGAGATSDADFGEAVATRKGVVLDGDNADGTGRDFLYPKTLYMVERSMRDNAEAGRFAARERARRDFLRTSVTVEMPYHGQVIGGTQRTLFAPDTIARVIDDEIDLDDDFLVYSCSYKSSRQNGETTTLMMVPRGTEIVA
jgi:prophage tail gpP-like protein